MPIPDYQSLMLPLLTLIGDGREHSLTELRDAIANQLSLSEGDLRETLPSGAESRFHNRVGWALKHLAEAGLLERPGRGRCRITKRGSQVLTAPPDRITLAFLRRFPEFREWSDRSRRDRDVSASETAAAETSLEITPEEMIDQAHHVLHEQLSGELLDRLKSGTPQFFERVVVDLLVAMGYGGSRRDAAQAIGGSGDGGVDGVIKEDRLGLDVVYIQAKRWDVAVGRPVVQAFAGALDGHAASKGVFITTSRFTRDADEYVDRIAKKIVLIDGERLAELMVEHNVGVSERARYILKVIDTDYFEDA
jgi:restriction system protein